MPEARLAGLAGISMVIRIVLALIGLFYVVNGGYMLAAPEAWYAAIPGVIDTGPMNHHFIQDIGLAYAASGAGLLLGARTRRNAGTLALAGATWPALHAMLHLAGWVMHGIPAEIRVALNEAIGVMALAVLGAVLAILRARREGAV
jgi:hypothetical protein